MRRIICGWAVMMGVGWGFAAEAASASLPALIEELLNNNPELQQLTAEIAAARARIPQASALDDPRFMVEASDVPARDPSFARTEMSGWQLSLRQQVPFPTKLHTRKQMARAHYQQVLFRQLEQRNQLVAKFKHAFYEYAFVTQALRVTDETIARLRALVATLEAKYAAGQIPQHDVLKTKVELSTVLTQRIQYRAEQRQWAARLTSWLARSMGMPFEVTLPPVRFRHLTYDLEALRDLAVNTRPWLAKGIAEIDEAKQGHRLAKQGLLPDFEFSAGYRVRSDALAAPGDENLFSAGVELTIPLWAAKKQARQIAEMRHTVRAAEAQQAAVHNEVRYQVESIYYALQQARDHYTVLRTRLVPEARAALEAARTSYEAGEVDYVNVITNALNLFASQLELYRQFYNHEQQMAELAMATGQRVSTRP